MCIPPPRPVGGRYLTIRVSESFDIYVLCDQHIKRTTSNFELRVRITQLSKILQLYRGGQFY